MGELDESGMVAPLQTVDDFLAHFGVKGQRWGVRKDHPGETSKTNHRKTKLAIAAMGAVFVAAFLAKHGSNTPYDYGYTYPNVDIGPMGLDNFRFGLD
jgi:hypothetical protein